MYGEPITITITITMNRNIKKAYYYYFPDYYYYYYFPWLLVLNPQKTQHKQITKWYSKTFITPIVSHTTTDTLSQIISL